MLSCAIGCKSFSLQRSWGSTEPSRVVPWPTLSPFISRVFYTAATPRLLRRTPAARARQPRVIPHVSVSDRHACIRWTQGTSCDVSDEQDGWDGQIDGPGRVVHQAGAEQALPRTASRGPRDASHVTPLALRPQTRMAARSRRQARARAYVRHSGVVHGASVTVAVPRPSV